MTAFWKSAYRSFYYHGAPEPDDPVLMHGEVALLVIDVQNTYLGRHAKGEPEQIEHAWQPFAARMRDTVMPNIARIADHFRKRGLDVFHARIACQKADGRDRSLSQKKPGFNNLLLPVSEYSSQIVDELAPLGDEVVVTKTTDSALTGTNLRLMLSNMGLKTIVCAGIFTDQCVSSTVRSLADESFDVIVLHDACAAGTMDIHDRELETLNMIYCQVMSSDDLIPFLPPQLDSCG